MPMTNTKKGSGLQVVNQEKTRVLGRQFIFHPLRMREDFERKQFLAHQVQVLVDREGEPSTLSWWVRGAL